MKTCKVTVFTTAGQTISFNHVVEAKVSHFNDRPFLKLLSDDESLVIMSFEHISYARQWPYHEDEIDPRVVVVGGKEEETNA